MSFTQAVKAEAQRLGFQLVGVTTPDPPPHLAAFEDWLAAGRHGEMDYLATERARQRRADPRQILPECRSILVLGMRYPTPDSRAQQDLNRQEEGTFQGRIASYAWGEDYHEALPDRLKALVEFIENKVGHPIPNRWYTDTGPILERELAQRAGLGWIGKNTCLIHPGRGSYFLLAEILLGIELEPDSAIETDHCGTCTRCLEACPTSCILPDRTLDAQRCISYLTIELKGPIPDNLRSQVGEWVFGCDICQEVCPWNQRFADNISESPFLPRPGVTDPNLPEELSLSADAFNNKFKGSPVRRAKRRGYLRNVATALGNLAAGSPDRDRAVDALASVLSHEPEPLVRAHAAWALGRIAGEAAREVLEQALSSERDEGVRNEIRAAMRAANRADSKNMSG